MPRPATIAALTAATAVTIGLALRYRRLRVDAPSSQ
jgi:hypothetical protein